jgi:hypothetical protein
VTDLARSQASSALVARTTRFKITVNGYGTIEIHRFTSAEDEYLSIRTEASSPGAFRLTVDSAEICRWEYGDPPPLFIPAGSQVVIFFESVRRYAQFSPGSVDGTVRVEPARAEAVRVAHQTFGLQPGFTEDDLRAAYRRLVKIHHPDLGGDEKKMRAVNFFHEILRREPGS